MKSRRCNIVGLMVGTVLTVGLTGCSLIDDDLSDCGEEATVNYDLTLVTNLTTELTTQLTTQSELTLSQNLRTHLGSVFTDFAHDVDLSFYDTKGDSLRLFHDEHIMNANQASYTLNLPMHHYMHLAAANILSDRLITLEGGELCHYARLQQTERDTIDSFETGVFTARQPMEVLEGIDQHFNVHLYMANCAAVLVIDPRGHDVSGLKVYSTGFASRFNICDSTYFFSPYPPIVRTSLIKSDDGDGKLGFCSVTFPSPEPQGASSRDAATRTVIETTEPFVSQSDRQTLWQFNVYNPQADGTVTETILSVHEPLRAGQLRIIKGQVGDDGGIEPADETVGVSVTLDWSQAGQHEITL